MSRCSPDIPNIQTIYFSKANQSIARFAVGLATVIGLFGGALIFTGCVPESLKKLGFSIISDQEVEPKGPNTYQKITGEDAEDSRGRWDQLFNTTSYVFGREPAAIVKESIHWLPIGKALDIAMGEGRNAVFLAKKGFVVVGVDYSEVAIQKAKLLAKENQVRITTENADLNHYVIAPETYDVILNIQYLQRSLISQIKRGLKSGGVVVFENYLIDQIENNPSEKMDKEFLLKKGELKALFSDFKILVYRETNDGKEAVAVLIAKKP